MGEVIYRRYRDGDEAAINEGFNLAFGVSRPLDEWRWKFPAEPEGRWIMVAVDETGRVLAHYGATASRMQLGGVTVRAGQPVDVYSLPEVRGTRIFTACYEEFIARFGNRDDLPVMYGFPGGKHYHMGLRQLQYVLLRGVPYWVRPVRTRWRFPFLRPRVRTGFDVAPATDLWRRASRRYPFATVRDGGYLGRRFARRHGVDYRHLSVWDGGRPRAWAVVVARQGVLKLAELVWDGASSRALAALDAELDRRAAVQGCEQLEAWLGGDAEAERAFEALGWERRPEPNDLQLVARCFHEEVDLRVVAERLYLTMGDGDLV